MPCKILAVLLAFSAISLSAAQNLPVMYDMTELQGTGPTCPSDSLRQAVRDEMARNVSDTLELIAPFFIPGLTQQLPATSCQQISNNSPDLPSGDYWVFSSDGTPVEVYCDMDRQSCCNETGGWTRIAFLNMTDPNQACPSAWSEITSPRRLCGRPSDEAACHSVTYPSHGIPYSRVCGRAVAYQFCTPDAFNDGNPGINGNYIDGLSVTFGDPRQHVWSFVAGVHEGVDEPFNCPCSSSTFSFPQLIPSFVGNDYFCDTAPSAPFGDCDTFLDDPLWDGAGCGVESSCCELRNPPWFCKTLNESTTDDIEVRLCGDEPRENEDSPVELIEIFVS